MYISYDKGTSWNKFQKNLPIVPITDLTIKDNSLIVATQGRSIWMLDDLTVIHQLSSSVDEEKKNLIPWRFCSWAHCAVHAPGPCHHSPWLVKYASNFGSSS